MKSCKSLLIHLLAGLALLALSNPQAEAQVRPKPNSANDYFQGKLLAQTQEMLADVVLQSALDGLWSQAVRHGHFGEYNHFINICRTLIEGNPGFFAAYDTAAHLLWSTDRIDEGLALLKRGLAANPKSFYFYDELGQHYMTRVKDHKTAIIYYEQAVKFECPWMTHNMLALCYEKTGQLEKAVKALERAAAYPDNTRGKVRLENARKALEKRKGGN